MNVELCGKKVLVYCSNSSLSQNDLKAALCSRPFLEWVSNMERIIQQNDESAVNLNSIDIQSIDMFGTRVGFVKLKADVTINDKRVPGICFLRGMGVGVLVSLLCKDTGNEYCVLVQQPRIPVGEVAMLELPAGMLDDSGTFTGVAASELSEECGLTVQESNFTDLTELAYKDTGFRGICPSPGGCDEYIRLLYCQFKVTQEEISNMQGRLGGLRDHGEIITLRIVKMEDVWKVCCDTKAIGALFLLEQLRKAKKL